MLIPGGAGGVGSSAVQLAKWKGAEVFATASAKNQQWLRDLGATPIAYDSQATTDHTREVDLILDCVGVASGVVALPKLRLTGQSPIRLAFSLQANDWKRSRSS